MSIDELLRRMVEIGASDLHLKVGSPPGFRRDGWIVREPKIPPLRPEDTENLANSIMDADRVRIFEEEHDIDFGHSVPGVARFRVNVFRQRGSVSMVVRRIPIDVPDIDALELPEICKRLALKPSGLVLVTGPAGSGKSTTLAAMVNYVNEHVMGHILTLEDPVEFLHQDRKCYVNQREVGADTSSFAEALRRSEREDPDVILVGELRDLETIALTLTAAEMGHLVFATLHTTSAVQTVDRVIEVFPNDRTAQIRLQLAATLQAVISQILLPRIGGGRVAAHEVMVGTPEIRGAIREGRTDRVRELIRAGEPVGARTLESALAGLVRENRVTLADALAKANDPALVRRLLAKASSGASAKLHVLRDQATR
jgi:twitching motility protein PilT